MAWMKWFPWKFTVRHMARAHGFIDPIAVLARLHRFTQPAAVAEPIELLRAGVVMHARGLINSRAIQHNMDWVWPYWVERQFNPRCRSFIPRAFSITHINLSHRNWTALGLPDFADYPIVDPRGLLTPFFDGWSLDCWIITRGQRCLLPSRAHEARQFLDLEQEPRIRTELKTAGLSLQSSASVALKQSEAECIWQVSAKAADKAWLAISLRPYNPEGISFIHDLSLAKDRAAWLVDNQQQLFFSEAADRHAISTYRHGDIFSHLPLMAESSSGHCRVGMLTAAALFKLQPAQAREIRISIPLGKVNHQKSNGQHSWAIALQDHCQLRIPDQQLQFLYDAAIRTLILLSPADVFPGPYTYKRFWFRDAAFFIHALLCAGLIGRSERALRQFAKRQTGSGYFLSQEGEWDSNGQVLWILCRFCELTGQPPQPDWLNLIRRGANWISRKRVPSRPEMLHSGLLPAGFSAEHLGPIDFYYWDDFWGIAGLRAAARLLTMAGDAKNAGHFQKEAEAFELAVSNSLEKVRARLGQKAFPASPYRRLDAGAIGSLVSSYPLQLCSPTDEGLLNTTDFLLKKCMIDGGFFQDMTHSGINAYLTLHLAQVLLRAGRPGHLPLLRTVAGLASPTGQWPEAIHPRTRGGCMGDGQHAWAAAEWILLLRNCFVREEGESLILGSGIERAWLRPATELKFGPAPTSFGEISLTIALLTEESGSKAVISWQAAWHRESPQLEARLPGFAPATINRRSRQQSITLNKVPDHDLSS